MDKIDPRTRSLNMAKIKSKNTKPELVVRKILRYNGLKYVIHDKNIIGKPDIFIPQYNVVIFVHGCFWHQHKACKYFSFPKTNVDFWRKKFTLNINRDKKNIRLLNKKGYKVMVLWECQIFKSRGKTVNSALLQQKISKIKRYEK
jgi:DNA mismatch endonuclease (patch repair protein)